MQNDSELAIKIKMEKERIYLEQQRLIELENQEENEEYEEEEGDEERLSPDDIKIN